MVCLRFNLFLSMSTTVLYMISMYEIAELISGQMLQKN